jgi:hypothetical protein
VESPTVTRLSVTVTTVAPPKRTAAPRTAAAVAEDLGDARRVGGLFRASEGHLVATIDLLALTAPPPEEEGLSRASDLLLKYVRAVCQGARQEHEHDPTVRAAAEALETLLTRPPTDRRIAQRIRVDAVTAAGHHVTADAVRHRENRLINQVAAQVFADLRARLDQSPPSLEAAIHRLVPIASDLRQQLHDGLCLTYMQRPSPNSRDHRVIEGYYRQVFVKLADLLVACDQLLTLGVRSTDATPEDFWFIRRAQSIGSMLFDEAGDRDFVLEAMRGNDSEYWDARLERLLATSQGPAAYDRWVAWAGSCFPTCAFERSTYFIDMCSPHQLVTWLYDVEIHYLESGYSELNIAGNIPMLHHGLS